MGHARRTALAVFLAAVSVVQAQPQDGPVVKRHENGRTAEQYTLREGKRTGEYRAFYEDGQLRLEQTYQADLLTGPATLYHPGGQKHITARFESGQLTGLWTSYREDGSIAQQGEAGGCRWGANDIKSPVAHGEWTTYHENGKRSRHGLYREGVAIGEHISYRDSGEKFIVGTFEDGQLTGPWTRYHPGGIIDCTGDAAGCRWSAGDLSSPIRQGPWTYNHPDGTPAYTGSFSANEAVGPHASFREDGSRKVEATFEGGQLTGQWTSYYPDGAIHAQGQAAGCRYGGNDINSPVRQGPWIYNHASGTRSYEGSFESHQAHGPHASFDEEGRKRFDANFDQGQLTGLWTSYHPTGEIAAHGRAGGCRYGGNDISAPVREGPWIYNHPDGTPSYRGEFAAHKAQGPHATFREDGSRDIEATFQSGQLVGAWTRYHATGAVSQRGWSIRSRYSENDISSPVFNGPYASFWENGRPKSRGQYAAGERVGTWLTFDEDGRIASAVSIGPDGAELPAGIVKDDDTGRDTVLATNPDGTRTRYTLDPHGNIIGEEQIDPHAGPSASAFDPDTGITTHARRGPGGDHIFTTSEEETLPDGTTRTTATDSLGNRTVTDRRPDGASTITRDNADGTRTTIERAPDGTVTRTDRDLEGNTEESVSSPDGSIRITRKDPGGETLGTTTRTPDGREVSVDPAGIRTERSRDAQGRTTEKRTFPDGREESIVRDARGRVIERVPPAEPEPGQRYAEDILGRDDWDELDPEARARAAEQERILRESGDLDPALDRIAAQEQAAAEAARQEELARAAEAQRAAARAAAGDPDPISPARPADATDPEIKKALDKSKESIAAAESGLSMLDAFIQKLPKSQLEKFQAELSKAVDGDPSKVAELLAADRKGLAGFLNRNPGILKSFEERILPSYQKGASVAGSLLSLQKGVNALDQGNYAEAGSAFIDAGLGALKTIPESRLKALEHRLGRSAEPSAAFLKSVLSLGQELNRDKTPDQPLNHGLLFKEAVSLITNGYQSMPDAQRAHFVERLTHLKGPMQGIEKNAPGIKRVLGLLDAAPEIYSLYRDWGSGKTYVNIANLAQKLGPKAIGGLVYAQTRSEAAADLAEFIAQQGTDQLAELGKEAREAAKAAFESEAQSSAVYARQLAEAREAARRAGLDEPTALSFTGLQNAIGGHDTSMALSTLRQRQDVNGIREAVAAYQRLERLTERRAPAVAAFYDRMASSEPPTRAWRLQQVGNADIVASVADQMLADYTPGSAAHRFLRAYRDDLRHMVNVYR